MGRRAWRRPRALARARVPVRWCSCMYGGKSTPESERTSREPWSAPAGEAALVAEAEGDAAAIEVLEQGDGSLAGGAERLLGLRSREGPPVLEGATQCRHRPLEDAAPQVQPGRHSHQHTLSDQRRGEAAVGAEPREVRLAEDRYPTLGQARLDPLAHRLLPRVEPDPVPGQAHGRAVEHEP